MAFPREVWNGHKQVSPKVNLIRLYKARIAWSDFAGIPLLNVSAARGSRTKSPAPCIADNFVITGATKALLEDDVKPLVEAFLRSMD
jgi:hypothetical protein